MDLKETVLFALGILLVGGCLTTSSLAATVSMKCSFAGPIPQEILFVVNADTKEVSVIGKFGTHKATLVSHGEGFFYVIEPNKGASVATIIYVQAGETPVGIRTTLGLLQQDQYEGIPQEFRLESETLRFMGISSKGRCPIQR